MTNDGNGRERRHKTCYGMPCSREYGLAEQLRRRPLGRSLTEPGEARITMSGMYSEAGGDDLDEEGRCPQPIPEWLARLHPMLPEKLFGPVDPIRECFCFRKFGASEDCGLLCFSTRKRGKAYMKACLSHHGFVELRPISLDDACDIARGQHFRVNCVALIDDPRHPLIQAVR
jgi:hypothetical protein